MALSLRKTTVSLTEGPSLTLIKTAKLNQYVVNPIMFKAYDAQVSYRQLQERGVKATEPLPFHHYWCFECTDPDGYPIDVTSERETGYEDIAFIRMQGNFYPVKDIAKSIEWYQPHLGAEIEYDFTMDSKVKTNTRACTFTNIPIALVESEAEPLVHMQSILRTANARAEYEALRSSGVTVTDLVEEDGSIQFRFADCDGHEIGMIETAK